MTDFLRAEGVREALRIADLPEWEQEGFSGPWEHKTLTANGDTCSCCGGRIPHPRVLFQGSCRCTMAAAQSVKLQWYEHHGIEPPEWGRAGVPPRHRTATFETFIERPGTEVALAKCLAWAEAFEAGVTTKGLYLSGPWGSGKTHLVVATAHRVCLRTLAAPLFVTVGGLIAAVKGGPEFDMKPADRARAAELLVLDDVGQVGRTEFDRELIYSLIADRYEQAVPTLFTSNVPPDRVADSLGGAAVSRLYESTTQVVLNASDYRRHGASG